MSRYAQLAAVYPRHDQDMVSSHNDLFKPYAVSVEKDIFRLEQRVVASHNDLFKPDNILFDGHRVWLVDWKAAFLNNRYADLAVVANLVVTNDAEERVYLQEYFGQPPDQYQLARFFLMQQVAHIFYAMAFLLLGSSGRQLNLSENAPDFGDFRRRIWAGEVNLADNQMKTVYGWVHREQLL